MMGTQNDEFAGDAQLSPEHVVIARDPGFVRVIADNAFTLFLGRDLDIALLAAGPLYQTTPARNGPEVISNVMNEVARVRVSPGTGIQMATSILVQLLTADQMPDSELETFIETVRQQVSELRGYQQPNGDLL